MFAEPEEDDPPGLVKYSEEAPDMATDSLKSTEKWSHLHPALLKAGRCTHQPPPGNPDDEGY